LGTVLANDEIINGLSERGSHPVIRKKMTQWSMRISAYADRLLSGLETIDWTDALKESQRNWIGKSVGASVIFNVKDHNATIEVFTTRPDTIFGVSFMTLAPEHALVETITTSEQKTAVTDYVLATSKRSERERMADVKTISGVFTGAYAEHPFTKQPIPIWIGDYVLAGYGTGAVMAVPCGDQRDYDFAKHFKIPIPNIFKDVDISEAAFTDKSKTVIGNSDFLNELNFKSATKSAIQALEALGQGLRKINYRLRDAVFSRQRYWGEPFPVYYVDGMPQMVGLEHLPITLPDVEKYLPTEAGDPPLGRAEVWAWDTQNNVVVNNSEIDHKTVFPLELNTMPGWAGSSWYFNRYMDAHNTEEFASKEALDYWQQVDLYIGGSEHATGHLLYARFWQKFMFDRGYVPVDEFAKKLINQGMILGTSAFAARIEGSNTFVSLDQISDEKVQFIHVDVTFVNASDEMDVSAFKAWRKEFASAEFKCSDDGSFKVKREVEKMSKSKYNVVNPDAICEAYGADALRLYEMFLGPLEQYKPWNTAGITGVFSFLKKLWKLYINETGLRVTEEAPPKEALKTLHKTIKKVTEDIEQFSFNTSVSNFMIAVNELSAQKCTSRSVLEPLLVLIAPYAPHVTEELWSILGHDTSISRVEFPVFEPRYLVESTKNYPISFNGKMRFTLELPLDLSKEAIEKRVLENEKTITQLDGRIPNKVIVVPGKIVNIVG
jgi:leucyl-tRNA synthetase